MSRMNRGNPSLSASGTGTPNGTGATATSGGTRGVQRPPSSYAGATSRSTAGEWASPGGSASNTAKTNKPPYIPSSSPNPNAQPFVASAASPWATPGGGGGGGGTTSNNARFKPRGSTGAARTLFGEKGGQGWEDRDGPDGGGGDLPAGEEAGSLLRNNHPEHWESYDAASSNASTMPSTGNTEPASLNLTPFDSPSLGPYRADLGEKLILDERGTDISLSLIKKDGEGAGEVSIHMLSLLYDPPVQGCELKPYVSIVDPHGRVTAVTTDESATGLDFRWFRGQKRVCSNTTGNCTKAATIQCVSCAKMSASVIPQHLTYFCSEKCLKENWPQHKQLHMQQHLTKRTEPIEWNYDEEEEDDSVTTNPAAASTEPPSSLHCNYPSVLQNTWSETGSDRGYTPTTEDVGRALRLECAPILKGSKDHSKQSALSKEDAPITSTSQHTTDMHLGTVVRIDTGAVIPTPQPPPPRTILYTDPSTPINSANTFKVICYNVLAQIYATRSVYPYTSIWSLSWEYRRNLLLREILSHHADVIALQEVQSNHFENFFQPQLSKHGYDGIFKRKTRDAGSDSAGAAMIDGCATFYKRERFALMEQYGIDFSEAARQHTSNRTQLRRLLRGNIALVLVLEELTPPSASGSSSSAAAAARRNRKRRLCITNTHIFWDPEYPDVKLWQTWVLCQELEKLVLPRNLPLVLCGDFNSLVESSVYELLSTERVEQGEDVFGSTGDPTGLLPAPHAVSHRLPLISAYATIGEPKYTNYTGSFVGVLDYIFFTRTHLRCVACLDVDDEALLRQHTALPSPHYPSDHIALVTTLEFIDP